MAKRSPLFPSSQRLLDSERSSLLSTELSKRMEALERYCLERRRDLLKRGVRELLHEYPEHIEIRNQCLDWLWRAGLQREGIKVALPKGDIGPGDINPEKLGLERALWLMLCLIGQSGWPYAWQWVDEFSTLRSPNERGLLGGILTELGEYDRAWDFLGDWREDQDLQAWVIRMFLAWKCEKHVEGAAAAQRFLILIPDEDRITRWWVSCLLNYFLGMQGDAPQYVLGFTEVDRTVSDASSMAPRLFAFTRIWLATLQAKAGNLEAAREEFARSVLWFREKLPDYIPVRVLDTFYWKSKVLPLTASEQDLLLNYPGPPPHLRRFRNQMKRGSNTLLPASAGPQVKWKIAPKADEYWINGQPQLGVPLEIRLLAIIRRSGSLGIHRNLAKALLWPHELRLYFQLDGRLAKLLERLRSVHGIEVETDRECYFLSEGNSEQIEVDRIAVRPQFLVKQGQHDFGWEDVARHYCLGPTQTRATLRAWALRGWISKRGTGRFTRYILNTER